ncbi:MAG: heavy metal translocating P-type ATPase [bacterium]
MSTISCPIPELKSLPSSPVAVPLPNSQSIQFRERFINQNSQGLSEVTLLLEGLRCAGCSRTVEQLLEKKEGVVQADLNYSTHQVKLVWDETNSSLEGIIQAIRQAGYDAQPQPLALPGLKREATSTRKQFPRLMLAVFGAMNLMWIAIAQYAGYFSGMEQRHEDLLNLASFVLATPVLFYSGSLFFQGAWRDFKLGVLGMDFQVALSTSLIYLYSCYAALYHSGNTYFEAVAMFIAFLSVGKYLEQLGTRKILEQSRFFQKLMPLSVHRILGEQRVELPLEDIQVGMLLELLPGEKVAVDGKVTDGEAIVDESHLTGEPMPILKKQGCTLTSGSICQDGVLQFRVTRSAEESTLAQIIRRVEESLSSKPKIRVMADRVAKYFVMAITLVAAGTFFWVWQQNSDLEQALMQAMAVLIIACPCALSLATPIAVLTGLSSATQNQILFRTGSQFETLRSITDVVLDKTGTITLGRPEVSQLEWAGTAYPELALSLTSHSNHPISKTIQKYLSASGTQPTPLNNWREVAGRGLRAEWQERMVLGGNQRWLEEAGVVFTAKEREKLDRLSQQGGSLFLLAVENHWVGTFQIEDQVRETSPSAIRTLQQLGLQVHLLTGDHTKVAQQVGQLCGIESSRIIASTNPEQKLDYIRKLQSQRRKVLMVGDGLNDAPALAQADIGIAMGTSTDKSLEISDLVLLGNDLQALVEALAISRRTFGLIRQNLLLSLIYNLIALPLALTGFVIPLVAALSMSLSSLLVVLNSLRSSWRFTPSS